MTPLPPPSYCLFITYFWKCYSCTGGVERTKERDCAVRYFAVLLSVVGACIFIHTRDFMVELLLPLETKTLKFGIGRSRYDLIAWLASPFFRHL